MSGYGNGSGSIMMESIAMAHDITSVSFSESPHLPTLGKVFGLFRSRNSESCGVEKSRISEC